MNTIPPDGHMPPQQPAFLSVDHQRAILWHRIGNAASWWYWIAGLTAVNTGALFFHSPFGFALGTGAVDLVNAIIQTYPRMMAGGLAIDAAIIGLIALCGLLCARGARWAFWTGMILYGLDTILVLRLQEWISAAFHAYAIYRIYQGAASLGLLARLEAAVAAQAPYYAQGLPPHAEPSALWTPAGGAEAEPPKPEPKSAGD